MSRVLVVDDSSVVTNMVSGYLSGKGHIVNILNTPFGVISKIQEFKPDVVLMDLGLPGLTGEKLLGLCKDKEKELGIRIIVFSSMEESFMKELVRKGLAYDYYSKGGPLKDLEEKITHQASLINKTVNQL